MWAVLAVILALLISCREKSCDNCDVDPLMRPLGLAFSVPSGEVSFFNANRMEIVNRDTLTAQAVVAAAVNSTLKLLVVADDASSRIAILTLPELDVVREYSIGGAPVDIEIDREFLRFFVITQNGNFWAYSIASGEIDTLDVKLHPRRMAFRPPQRGQAWVVSAGNNMLHIIDVLHMQHLDSLALPTPPSDVVFSPDGATAYLSSSGDPGGVSVYHASSRDLLDWLPGGTGPFDMGISDDGHYLAAVDSTEGQLHVWNLPGDAHWSVPACGSPARVLWLKESHVCLVLCPEASSIIRFNMSTTGPYAMDTLFLSSTARDLVLWED